MNNYYKLFIAKVIQLAETIVIKSTDAAEGMNRYLTDYYGPGSVDYLDPTSWRYYLNLAGQYHPIDRLMEVVSMDTLETIVFSKENLLVHRATARGYQYGTRSYKELVARYPDQEMLILGILYPVEIQKAIAARDGEILTYPADLVEANEYSLIPRLQQWIDGFKTRWDNKQFGISDSLYPATMLGIMYLNLIPAILTLRKQACKTNEAHSFHVRQYLASHGFLDVFFDQLTLKQRLFFYRNIAYIERNVGKRDTFEWLVEHIMTERSLPLAEYVMRHDLSAQPTEFYPEIIFRQKPINMATPAGTKETITLPEMFDKQDTLARDNFTYRDDYETRSDESFKNSLSNVVLTKTLESSVVDYSNSTPYTLEDILFNHWLALAARGMYKAVVSITNPRTGEKIPLTMKDAYVFVWYAFCKSINIDLVTVPQFLAKRVQRDPLPAVTELLSVVDSTLVSKAMADYVLGTQPILNEVVSTEAFYNLCKEIYVAANIQRHYVAYQEHAIRRAMVHNMISRLYADCTYNLTTEDELYEDWFSARNIDTSNWTTLDLATLYIDTVRESTGLALQTTNSIQDLQAAMIRMLSQLSSYSIQFVAEINSSGIKKTDWTVVRVGHVGQFISAKTRLDSVAEVLDVGVKTSRALEYDIWQSKRWRVEHMRQSMHYRLEIGVGIQGEVKTQQGPMRVDFPSPYRLHSALVPNDQNIIPVIGIESYLGLAAEEQQGLKDIYTRSYSSLPTPVQVHLGDIVTNRDLGDVDGD